MWKNKKIVSAILALLLLFGFSGIAQAAKIETSTDPATITSAGYVTLKFSVTNDSENDMRQMSITGYGVGSTTKLEEYVLPPGYQIEFTASRVNITEDMLGKPEAYLFTWYEDSEKKAKEFSVVFGEQAAPAAMTGTRTLSRDTGKEGDKVTVTYSLRNPSAVQMTDIHIRDPIAGNSAVASPFSIEAGGSQNVTYEYTIGTKDAVSEPVITYKANDEEKTLKIEPLTIKYSNVSLTVRVSAADPSPEGVLFSIVLQNDGNQNIGKVQITDEQGNKVNQDTFTLAAGDSKTLTYLVQTESIRNVAFTVKGTDALGQPYENITKSMEARPYVDPGNINISLAATIIEPLSESGRMKVRFAIQNNSSVAMSEASIEEAQLGTQYTVQSLPGGETVVEKDLLVSGERELEFVLAVYDPSGTKHTYPASVSAAYVKVSTPPPAQEDAEAPESDEATKTQGNTLITVLIVLAALMGVAGIALLILSVYERKRNRAMQSYDTEEGLPPVRTANANIRRGSADHAHIKREEAKVRELEYDDKKTYPRQTPRGGEEAAYGAQPPLMQEAASKRVNVRREDGAAQEPQGIRHAKPYEARSPYYPRQENTYAKPGSIPAVESPYRERAVREERKQARPIESTERPQQPMPASEQQKAPASANIRNRVHRVRPKHED